MKRAYTTPVATEELFAANNYIASCQWRITSTVGNNRMQCANPSHSHFMNGTYFTSVWVAATNSTCQIIVSSDGIGKTSVLNNNNAQPASGAVVYGQTGTKYYCTSTYIKDNITYNVPDSVTGAGTGPCYGTYCNTGNYSEIKEKVLS